jgi:hypothetical protein
MSSKIDPLDAILEQLRKLVEFAKGSVHTELAMSFRVILSTIERSKMSGEKAEAICKEFAFLPMFFRRRGNNDALARIASNLLKNLGRIRYRAKEEAATLPTEPAPQENRAALA